MRVEPCYANKGGGMRFTVAAARVEYTDFDHGCARAHYMAVRLVRRKR